MTEQGAYEAVAMLADEVLRHDAGLPRQDEDHPDGMSAVEAATILLRRYRLASLPDAPCRFCGKVPTLHGLCHGHWLGSQMPHMGSGDRG